MSNKYRIVLCEQYNAHRLLDRKWWIVQCYKKKWYTLGKYFWFTETCGFGDYKDNLKFKSELEASEYIERMEKNVCKENIIQTPIICDCK